MPKTIPIPAEVTEFKPCPRGLLENAEILCGNVMVKKKKKTQTSQMVFKNKQTKTCF